MPRRGSILDSRSDRSTSRSDRSTSSKSFQTTSRHNNKGSTFHQPVYQNANEYYIPTLGSTHPPQHDYGRVDSYQYCEGFRFQDLLQTQGGFSRDNQLVYGGHNLYGSYGRVEGNDDDVNIRNEDEGDGSNERGVCDEDHDGVPSYHGSTSSPYNYDQSVKRKGFDTSIDPITRKKELCLYGTTEFNNASCGRAIGDILRSNFKGAWHSWEKVDSMCRDELFKEFKKKYSFPEEDESIVRNIWEDKARIALNQQLTRARKKAMSKENTTNIIDCLDKGPAWINNDDWNQMIKDVWSTPEFQRRSESARRNRLTKTDGKISTHSGGTVSFASYRANMQEEAGGKEPPWDDVFTALHQSTKQSGSFIDNKSKKVVENYKMEMISKYGTDRENHPSFDGAAWCVASGGVTKGRVYGAPRMPKSKVSTSSSSHSYSVESSYPSSSYRALQKEIKDKEEEIKKKDDFILEMKRQMDSMKEYLVNNLGYHGGTSNIDQGMPPPLTPSIPPPMAPQIMTPMGPAFQPIFRPTPRPLYPAQSSVDPQYHGSSSQPAP
ncbi:uncharacterized protein LOC133703424 [Populus nigra]|uniref:uncharacterized protein LOC133680745 n=2 Tax=Populus nigra TaxID=3691 RepID=UPI002B27739D|nr:uncharacterized protein LOC133680745 [Populus nigra]XP_061983897.1 uncharacterized protein LOC133703424 [Populus nigra]